MEAPLATSKTISDEANAEQALNKRSDGAYNYNCKGLRREVLVICTSTSTSTH